MLFGALFVNMQYFSIKMMEGIVATSYSSGDKFYIDPRKLLPLARFLPQPKYGLFAFHCHKLTCLNIMQLVCSQKSSWWRWIWVNINSWPINFPYFYLCFWLSLHFFAWFSCPSLFLMNLKDFWLMATLNFYIQPCLLSMPHYCFNLIKNVGTVQCLCLLCMP